MDTELIPKSGKAFPLGRDWEVLSATFSSTVSLARIAGWHISAMKFAVCCHGILPKYLLGEQRPGLIGS